MIREQDICPEIFDGSYNNFWNGKDKAQDFTLFNPLQGERPEILTFTVFGDLFERNILYLLNGVIQIGSTFNFCSLKLFI